MIGDEAREQALAAEGALPARVIACVGGGSNSIGIFTPFVDDAEVELIGVEAAGEGLDSGRHGASLGAGRTGVLHGSLSSVIADEEGQILEAHSISAGLDYPGVGPEHAHLRDTGRATYTAVTDEAALSAFAALSRLEGIIPALESSHAIAWLLENGGGEGYDVVCLSRAGRQGPGRGAGEERWLRSPRLPARRAVLAAFEAARAEGRAALMPYMMGGFPDHETSLAVGDAYADCRRRPDRARHPLLRPAGRRPDDPRGGHRGARRRRQRRRRRSRSAPRSPSACRSC